MRQFLLLSLLTIWSSQLFATDSVQLRAVTTHEAYAINGSQYSLYVDEPSGDATSETAPMTVYVPTGNTAQVSPAQNEFFYLSRDGYSVLNVGVLSRSSMAIVFPLRLNISTTAKYLTAAVKVSGAYKVVGQSTSTYSNLTNGDIDFNFSPYEFCSTYAVSGSTNPCMSNSVYTTDMTTYFFVTSSAMAQGDAVDTTQFTGVYFLLKFSNRVSTTITTAITSSMIGDRRVTIQYTSTGVLSNPKAVRIYDFDGSDPNIPSSGETIGSQTSGALKVQTETYAQDGKIIVTGLENSQRYFLSLTFLDKWGFATLLSPEVDATPLKIEELLKKNSCYLLTAGFGEDHYVINYFRHFRDTVLMNSFLGRKFIHFYYGTAPKYALIIYQHDYIRGMIRGMAYTLYFIFNYIYLILLVSLSTSVLILYRKKRSNLKFS